MIPSITIDKAYELMLSNSKVCLIDVRESDEIDFNKNILKQNHLNICWNSTPKQVFEMILLEQITDKNTPLIFLCAKGIRSHKAASLANDIGYKNCFNIGDGIKPGFYQKLNVLTV